MSQAENGNTVKVHYTGKLKDGEVFDTSEGRNPLEFKLGEGNVIPGFEEAVLGMNLGEKKTVEIEPEKAYGPHREEMVIHVPKDRMPPGAEIQPGMVLQMVGRDNSSVDVAVIAVGDETVTLDANHVLAGKDLIFDIELVEIA